MSTIMDEWNANAIKNEDGTFDVYFDWLGSERRMCASIVANSEEEAIDAVQRDSSGCLNRSRFVEAIR